jgi:hypothetical protein
MNLADLIDDLQAHYLRAPAPSLDARKAAYFDELYDSALQDCGRREIVYDCEFPKHEFLSYLVEHNKVLLHGSNEIGLDVLKPIRKSTDSRSCGNIRAIYACSDGIWPIFFAILNRASRTGSTNNDCFWTRDLAGNLSKCYYFSIDARWSHNNPWTSGMAYIVARDGFRQLRDDVGNLLEEWASPEPAPVLARLRVGPSDFPFLADVRVHNHKGIEPAREQIRLRPELYDAYTGSYQLAPGFVVDVKRKDDHLFIQPQGYPALEIYPESEAIFFLKAFDARIAFVRSPRGDIDRFIAYLNDEILPATRVA